MMRSASRAASVAIRAAKRAAIERQPSREALLVVAAELYDVADVLVAQPRLRRILGDPATDPEGRARLLRDLFGGRVGDAAVDIGTAIVRERWSSPWDMTDAFETAADDAMFAGAEKMGTLDEIVDELFRFERILDANSELTTLLDEPSVDPDRFLPGDHPRWPGHWASAPRAWGELPEQRLLGAETRRVISDAIDTLPPAQRTVISLRDVEGWSSEEVRDALDLSEGNQRVLLHRARSKVRAALDEYLADAA
jgi:RNA polymerase sigma factor (sigma-70 family)